jgi:hypothetical protein
VVAFSARKNKKMSRLEDVLLKLNLAIGRLERAKVDQSEVSIVQASFSDLEKILAGFKGQKSVHVANSASVLRTVARTLEQINDPDVRAAWADIIEAAVMTESSTHRSG